MYIHSLLLTSIHVSASTHVHTLTSAPTTTTRTWHCANTAARYLPRHSPGVGAPPQPLPAAGRGYPSPNSPRHLAIHHHLLSHKHTTNTSTVSPVLSMSIHDSQCYSLPWGLTSSSVSAPRPGLSAQLLGEATLPVTASLVRSILESQSRTSKAHPTSKLIQPLLYTFTILSSAVER